MIRQAIQRGIADTARVIRLAAAVEQQQRMVAATPRKLAGKLGREPTPEEIATANGLDPQQVLELAEAPRVVTSLDRSLGDQDETTLGMLIPADTPAVDEEVDISLKREQVRKAVTTMSEPARTIIRLRYGLDESGEPHSYAAIGRALSLGPDRVPQLEDRALKLLSHRRELELLRAT